MLLRNTGFLLIFVLEYSIASILQVSSRCVPTSTVQGPCHDCVCSVEGVYHCKRRQCYAVDLNQKRPKEYCQANFIYREDKSFCICSGAGMWRSDTCQERFRFLHPKMSPLHYELRTNVICTPGTLYIIDCNVCRCESSGFIDVTACTNRYCAPGHKADTCNIGDVLRIDNEICACSDINFYVDRLCLTIKNNPVQEVTENEIANLVELGNSWRRVDDLLYSTCDTEVMYSVDCNKCVCTEERLACTTKTCTLKRKIALRHEKSGDRKKDEFESLPQLHSIDEKCTPGVSYRYECNICHCTKSGVPSCPTMMCLENYVLDQDALRGALSFN